jgi:dethiobiotin synthetase
MKQTLFITGADTGVGKIVLTALLTRFTYETNCIGWKKPSGLWRFQK